MIAAAKPYAVGIRYSDVSSFCAPFVITLAEEVMFSSVSVCLLAGLHKKYSNDFHKIRWKGGTRATEELLRFWRQSESRHVRVRSRLGQLGQFYTSHDRHQYLYIYLFHGYQKGTSPSNWLP